MYLVKRSTGFIALHDIPIPLRPQFGGKVRFYKHLGTANEAEANRIAHAVLEEWMQALKAAARKLPKGVSNDMHKMHSIKAEGMAWDTKAVPVPEGARTVYKPIHTIRCAVCSAALDLMGPANMPPDVIRQKFAQKGWIVNMHRRQDNRCPEHAQRRPREPFNPAAPGIVSFDLGTPKHLPHVPPIKSETVKTDLPETRVEGPADRMPRLMPATEPPKADPKQLRVIMKALEAAFDEDTGRYHSPDMSDANIATQLALPVAMVSKVRDDAFGPLFHDPELDALKMELSHVTDELKALSSLYDDLEKKIADYERKKAK